MLIILFIFFCLSFIYTKDNQTQEDCLYIFNNNALIPIHIKNIQVTLSEQNGPPQKHLSKIVNNNTTLNMNITSYFLNILAFPYVSACFVTCGLITKTIKKPGLTKHHQKTVKRTLHMVNRCKEMEIQYTGKYYKSLWSTLPLKNLDEINILADAMENHLGLRYTTHLINCHLNHEDFNAVCMSTFNIAFLRLQPKRTKIQRIQQGTKNEGNQKEARRRQTKQLFIMLNLLPEYKE